LAASRTEPKRWQVVRAQQLADGAASDVGLGVVGAGRWAQVRSRW